MTFQKEIFKDVYISNHLSDWFFFFISLCLVMFYGIHLEMIIASFLAPIYGFLGAILLVIIFSIVGVCSWSLITGIFEGSLKKIKRFFIGVPFLLFILIWCVGIVREWDDVLLYIKEYPDVISVCFLCLFQYSWRVFHCFYLIDRYRNKKENLIDARIGEMVHMFIIASKRFSLGIPIGLIVGILSLLLYPIFSKEVWRIIFDYVLLFPIYCILFFPLKVKKKLKKDKIVPTKN